MQEPSSQFFEWMAFFATNFSEMTYYEQKPQLFVCKRLQISYTEKNGGAAMKYSWIDAVLLQKPGVTKDLQAEWNWIRYHIGGKMFAAVCLDVYKRQGCARLPQQGTDRDCLAAAGRAENTL